MSVENFIQDSIFGDTFTLMAENMAATQNFQHSGQGPAQSTSDQSVLPEYRVVRSTRRKRGVSAFRSNGIIEIHIPDRTSRRAEQDLIPEMIALVLAREAKLRRGDEELEMTAQKLLVRYLPEFNETPRSITWRQMHGRWGSCTTVDRTIRIAQRLASAPAYVLECVILHELIHLQIPGHGADFYELLARYPDQARAEAYLEGFESGLAAPPEPIEPQDLTR